MTDLAFLSEHETYSLIQMDDGKANAFSFEMIKALNSCFDQAMSLGKPIVLTGREKIFCAGFDLSIMQGADEEAKNKLMHAGFGFSYRVMDCDLPVVAISQGHALAMGGLLLLSCDYRIAAHNSAKIGLNEVSVGVHMPEYGVDLVKERINPSYQIPALANGVLYDPKSAVLAGFVDEASDAGSAEKRLHEITGHLSSLDAKAHRGAKQALRADILKKYRPTFQL